MGTQILIPINLPVLLSRAFFFGMIVLATILIIEASSPFTGIETKGVASQVTTEVIDFGS